MTMSPKSYILCIAILVGLLILAIVSRVLQVLRKYGKTTSEVILNLKIRYYIENYQYKKVLNLMEGIEDNEYFKKVIDLYSQFDTLKNSPCYDKFAFYLYALINVKECRDLAGQELWIIKLSKHTVAVAEWRPLALWFMISKQVEAEERPLLSYSYFYLLYKEVMEMYHNKEKPRMVTEAEIIDALTREYKACILQSA